MVLLFVNTECNNIGNIDKKVIMKGTINADNTENQYYHKRCEDEPPRSVTICCDHGDAEEGVMVGVEYVCVVWSEGIAALLRRVRGALHAAGHRVKSTYHLTAV